MSNYQTEAQRFSALKKILNLTQYSLADALGVTQSSISMIANGKRGISTEILKTLFEKYGVNPVWLLMGEGEPLITKREHSEIVQSQSIHEKDPILSHNIEQRVKDSRKGISDKLNMSHNEEVARLREQVDMLRELVDAKEQHLEDLRAVLRHYQQTDSDSDSDASEENPSGDVALAS
ncbi:MAG: helix-turn-helix transcriptional regulator [Bacteroidota bacterium]